MSLKTTLLSLIFFIYLFYGLALGCKPPPFEPEGYRCRSSQDCLTLDGYFCRGKKCIYLHPAERPVEKTSSEFVHESTEKVKRERAGDASVSKEAKSRESSVIDSGGKP